MAKKKVSATFAVRLAALRESAGLSQYMLAKQAGLSKQAVSRLESGDNEPTWDTLQKLALVLGVSCEQFVTVTELAPVPPPKKPGPKPKGGAK